MTIIKSSPVTRAAQICGLNHLQQAALERAFHVAHQKGLPPGDLLKIVAQHVDAARARPGNPYASKLDAKKASAIRTAHRGGASYAELAREFGVSGQSVKRVCLGLSYAPVFESVKKGPSWSPDKRGWCGLYTHICQADSTIIDTRYSVC